MENKKIGIKIADGSFYPILDGDAKQKKRMVLTTVMDNQESVQIDLYRGTGETLQGAQYIGSLMVEDIIPAEKGAAEIELDLGIDEDGQLESVAMDKASGAKQSLSVSLKNLEEDGLYDVPDFSFDDEETEDILEEELPSFSKEDILDENMDIGGFEKPSEEEDFADLEDFGEEPIEDSREEPVEELTPDIETESFDVDFDEDFGEESGELSGEEDVEEFDEPEAEPQWEQEYTRLNEGFEEDTAEVEEKKPGRSRPLLVALLVILALALIGALLYLFVFASAGDEPNRPLEAQQEQETVAESPAEADAPSSVMQTAEEDTDKTDGAEEPSSQPEKSGPAAGQEQAGPTGGKIEYTGGVWYKIRWGDTLWEISSSFYDNPWLYGEIANENEIPNPDRIFAEESIFIPKK